MAEKKKQNTGQMRLDKFLTEMGKGKPQPGKGVCEKGPDPGQWTDRKGSRYKGKSGKG